MTTFETRRSSALGDIATITRRDLTHWLSRPGPVVVAWLFPVMVVLMFGTIFGGAIQIPGGTSYYEYLMPGMFAMTMLFGLESTMTAVAGDAAKGVTDRFRSLPMNSAAVVAGRCAADMLNTVIGLVIIVGTGLTLGWRWHHGLAAALAAVALLLLLRFALLWTGIYLGLMVKGPESVVVVQILVWPLLFLSNAFVDTVTMPDWLGTIADWNPLSATASAVRNLCGNPGWSGSSWVTQHPIAPALLWPLLITAIFLPLSVRRFRSLGA
ncbi:ABC transporter permease [Nocardia transvalensis]|uniref:ABC transporter permease n=1 Tax=Nocardia transvalensis TaxID=37333 RepID=UPI0018954665|nr:ABC transporter permease [Nocardia transvalensis]MBF6330762.1 ABC transporter permease [Nocardia transvalensis]